MDLGSAKFPDFGHCFHHLIVSPLRQHGVSSHKNKITGNTAYL